MKTTTTLNETISETYTVTFAHADGRCAKISTTTYVGPAGILSLGSFRTERLFSDHKGTYRPAPERAALRLMRLYMRPGSGWRCIRASV